MAVWGTFFSAFLIGFSGAMMPGPMLGVAIEGSLRKGYIAGPLLVLGHGILEFTLVIAMIFGLQDIFTNPLIAGIIGLFGGTFLAWMGYDMIKSSLNKAVSLRTQEGEKAGERNLILAGIMVSLTNPYFVVWWASTGIELVRRAYILGLAGVLAFFIGHILADFTWYTGLAFACAKGEKLLNDAVYRWIILCLGAFLILFSLKFILGGWEMLFNAG